LLFIYKLHASTKIIGRNKSLYSERNKVFIAVSLLFIFLFCHTKEREAYGEEEEEEGIRDLDKGKRSSCTQ
jgi:hypothetical protein